MPFDLERHLRRWAEKKNVRRPSRAKLARVVHGRVSSAAKRRVKLDSLATKIGDLNDRVWWKNNDEFRQALCAELEIPESELLLDADEPGIIRFREFPDLPSLNLALEGPLPIHAHDLFRLVEDVHSPVRQRWSFDAAGATWVHMPAGSGRSLLATFHELHGALMVVRTTNSFPETQLPLLLLLDDELQLAAIKANLHQRVIDGRATLVLARFPRPTRGKHDPESATVDGRWRDIEWRPVDSWRHDLCYWIASRLKRHGKKEFTSEPFLAWLDRVDPDARLVSSPSMLLLVAFTVWSAQRPERQLRALERDLAGALLRNHLQQLAPSSDRNEFDRRRSELAALASARLASEEPWEGGWSKAQWCQVKLAGRRKTETTVQGLIELGLLEPTSSGRFDFRGGSLRSAIACEGEWLTNANANEWGAWAIRSDRRAIVDRALDLREDDELSGLTASWVLAAEKDPRDVGVVGAVEALFAAWGRRFAWRLARGERPIPRVDPALARLVAFQLSNRVVHHPSSPPGPATRPGPLWARGAIEWLLSCWAWSLSLPREKLFKDAESILGATGDAAGDFAWLFPGWFKPSLQNVPSWLSNADASFPRPQEDQWIARRLASLAKLVVARCGDAGPEESLPRLLALEVVLADRDGWDLSHAWPLADEQQQRELVRRLSPESEKATRILDRISRCDGIGAILVGDHGDPLRTLQRARLSPHLVEEWARQQANPNRILDCLSHAPAHVTDVLARVYLESNPDGASRLLSTHWHKLGRGSADLLMAWSRTDLQNRYMAIRALWLAAPDRALSEAREALQSNRPECHQFLYEAPANDAGELLGIIADAPAAHVNENVRRWCATQIGEARRPEELALVFRLLPKDRS